MARLFELISETYGGVVEDSIPPALEEADIIQFPGDQGGGRDGGPTLIDAVRLATRMGFTESAEDLRNILEREHGMDPSEASDMVVRVCQRWLSL